MKEFNFQETFKSDEYLYFYQNILTQERLNKEIDFLIKHTKLDEPLKILDLACGYGRHANVFAQLGHEVSGIDFTQGFLDLAKEEASKLNLGIEYIHQDMRNLNYDNTFDRIYVLFTAIGYFDDMQNQQVFRNIFSALKPGGIFCFDSYNRDSFLAHYKPSSVVKRENNFLMDQTEFDTLTGRCITKRTVFYNQSIKDFYFSIQLYNPTEIIKLFRQIGFSSVKFYEDWQDIPLSGNGKKMVVVAQK